MQNRRMIPKSRTTVEGSSSDQGDRTRQSVTREAKEDCGAIKIERMPSRRSPRPWSDLIWINTRAFAIRLHLHARVSVGVACWTFDAAILLYDTQPGSGRG